MTVSDIACHGVLEALFRRNGAVDVAGLPPAGDPREAPAFRVRLLQYSAEGLTIERPQQSDASRYIFQGATVEVLAINGNERWLFRTRVLASRPYALNDSTRVVALDLAPPENVRTGQRREFFRVSVAGAGLKPVLLAPMPAQPGNADVAGEGPLGQIGGALGIKPAEKPATPTSPAARPLKLDAATPIDGPANVCPIAFPVQPFHAKLLNLSGGGMGVETPQRIGPIARQIIYYRCQIRLPNVDQIIETAAEMRFVEEREGGTYYLGLHFDFLNPAHKRQCVDAICKFCAWHQRQQLQRLRDKG
ncbi:MAG: PilZ domain-containing protein [Planctomycetota bacterium]|nr:PilZ domain-containing protein [Planctomycetota bacterium]